MSTPTAGRLEAFGEWEIVDCAPGSAPIQSLPGYNSWTDAETPGRECFAVDADAGSASRWRCHATDPSDIRDRPSAGTLQDLTGIRSRRKVASDSLRSAMPAAPRTGSEYESPSLNMLMRRSWERPTQADWAEVLGALPLFSGLRKRQLRGLARLAKVVDYSPREAIVQKGEDGDSFYLVLEGRVRVLEPSAELGPGDFFGEMALLDGRPRSATVTATDDVRVMQLPRKSFLKALEQDPQIGLAIMKTLAERLRRLERGAFA